MWLETLAHFALRAAWGLAAAMLLTSTKQVDAGFFRVHTLVLLGLSVVAGLAWWQLGADAWYLPWLAVGVAYAAFIAWHARRDRLGKFCLLLLAVLSLGASLPARHLTSTAVPSTAAPSTLVPAMSSAVALVDAASSGLLLGSVAASMLLGHWYLNVPGMRLAPLYRLLALAGASVLLRALVCGIGWAMLTASGVTPPDAWLLVPLRWIAGIVGTGASVFVAWQTLRIPNTQSATGILYAGLAVVLLGELTSLLLARGLPYPL